MSEIFNWLRKSETERRKSLFEAVPPSVRIHPQESPERPPAIKVRPDDPDSISVQVGICSAGKFDLSAADDMIKGVLDPLTLVGEQFRLLRSKLSLMRKQRELKTLLVTSAVSNEGKTFTSCALAGVIAQEPGKRVIVIDADLRKPGSGKSIGLIGRDHAGGLSQVLRGEAAFHDGLLGSKNLEFYFMPAGPVPTNPSELLSSTHLEQTLKTAAQLFDWVVIDSPPVLALADTTTIAPLCDAVLLVVQADMTPTKLITESIQRIGREKICGIVMNRTRHLHYYYRDYHEYYHKALDK